MTDLTTLAAAKAYSGITSSADDVMLGSLIAAYSQWVRTFTNRDFTADNYEIWRDGRDNTFMLLPQYPVIDVMVLEIDGKSISRQSAFGLPGFRFTHREIILDGGLCFSRGQGNIHVIFAAGYMDVPTDIAQAVNELVGLRYANRDHQGWSSKSLAGEVVSLVTKDMPASVATILNQYSRKVPV